MNPRIPAVILAVLTASVAHAQWSVDPAANLPVADGAGDQVLPEIAATPDGGCYVGWFDGSSGSFVVRLQRLDADGVEQWAHNGIVVSSHPQNSALFGWDLIADSTGQCVLVFSDERDGGDLDIHAYRIGPDGNFTWGPDGVTLSSNGDFEPAPTLTETTDGDFMFVWPRLPNGSDGDIRMQRLNGAGTPQLVAGGRVIVSAPGESPAFAQVTPAGGGGVIVSYLRDSSTSGSDRHVRAARFNATGTMVWGPVDVFDAVSVPIAHWPRLVADGTGGAVIWWHRSSANFFNAFVQRLDSNGNELFAHNGVSVSTTATMHHLDPAVAWLPATQEILVFWNERTPNQDQWGIYGQNISGTGTRQWGAGGRPYLAVDAVNKSAPRVVPSGNGAMVFLMDQPGGFGSDRVLGVRVNSNGSQAWSGSPLVFSSTPSDKARLPVTAGPDGGAMLAWEDDRNGSEDVFVQNVNFNSSLGDPADVNQDGVVNVNDLVQLITDWGPCPSPCPSDTDGDGDVDVDDLVAVITAWS